jgi:hypothetical protein
MTRPYSHHVKSSAGPADGVAKFLEAVSRTTRSSPFMAAKNLTKFNKPVAYNPARDSLRHPAASPVISYGHPDFVGPPAPADLPAAAVPPPVSQAPFYLSNQPYGHSLSGLGKQSAQAGHLGQSISDSASSIARRQGPTMAVDAYNRWNSERNPMRGVVDPFELYGQLKR